MALTIQVGQQGVLTLAPEMVGIRPERVTNERWAPVGQDQSKVALTPPTAVLGVAPGSRTFRVEITLAPLASGDPIEKITYEFVVACVTPATATAVPSIVPVVLFVTPAPPTGG